MSLNSAICVARVSIPAVTWQSASLGVTDRRCPYPGMLPLLSALVGPAVVKMTTQSPSRNGASSGHNDKLRRGNVSKLMLRPSHQDWFGYRPPKLIHRVACMVRLRPHAGYFDS